jgi:hypothetical protein
MANLRKALVYAILASTLIIAAIISPASVALAGPDNTDIVIWYDDPFSFGFPDAGSGLAAWFGIDIAAACAGGDPAFSIIRQKDITLPQADQRIVHFANSDALPVTVWRMSDMDGFGCPVGAATPIASGLVRMRYTDNDAIAFIGDNPNANAWGMMAEGRLTRADGQPARFSSIYRNVWDGVDTLKINHFVLRIELR